MSRNPLNKCLTTLRLSESDSERLAALLLVAKLIKSEECDRDTRKEIFEAVGFKFLIRLLKTDKSPDGCSPNVYKSLALTLLACFCSELDLVSDPEMLKCIPMFSNIITTNPPDGDTEGSAMVAECYECMSCMAMQKACRSSLIQRSCIHSLCTVITHRYYHYERAWSLLEYLLSECGSSTWLDNMDDLQMLLTKLTRNFQQAKDKEVFSLCVTLRTVLSSLNKDQARELRCNKWRDDVYTTLLQLFQSILGPGEREASLGLASLLVDLLGVEWALDRQGRSRTFVLLLVHLSCVEVRMTLEDPSPVQIASSGSLVSACFVILESTISYMISESPLSLDEDQINQLHAAMVGAFNAVLFFLSQCQAHAQDEDVWVRLYPVVLASIRALGSWIAEETLALRKEVITVLPFLLDISKKTVQEALLAETVSMETDDVASGDCMTVSTPGSMVVAPGGEVLKFLLPGLCHLTADDKARRVLLDCDAHVTLMLYFHYRWKLFKSDGISAQESEVALTTLCGIFMNLCVLEANLASSDPVFKELLEFTVTALPSIGRDMKHIVVSSNLLVMGLMLLRLQANSLDVSSAHCDGFLTSCVQLLMGAHTGKPFTGNKVWEMCITDDYKPHWNDLSELWFLGMQTLDACISLFPSLATVVLESRWLPGLIKLLLEVKGRGVPVDVVTSYQGVLCSLIHCSLPARDVIQEKGGLQLARLYEMEELENILNN